MKTVIIFDRLDADVKFLVLDGDYRRFDKVYINAADDKEELQCELGDLLYTQDGKLKFQEQKAFPIEAVKAGAYVIVAGFLP